MYVFAGIWEPTSSQDSQVTQQTYFHVSGWFELCDLTEGQGPINISEATTSLDCSVPLQPLFRTKLTCGVQFQTGRLVWSVTALPEDQVLTIKMFKAARCGNLENLRIILDRSQCAVRPVSFVFSTPLTGGKGQRQSSQYKFSTVSIVTEEGIDVNTEYTPLVPDSNHLIKNPLSPSPFCVSGYSPINQPPCLLLHIAVQNKDLKMVLYLLEKGADVSPLLTS